MPLKASIWQDFGACPPRLTARFRGTMHLRGIKASIRRQLPFSAEQELPFLALYSVAAVLLVRGTCKQEETGVTRPNPYARRSCTLGSRGDVNKLNALCRSRLRPVCLALHPCEWRSGCRFGSDSGGPAAGNAIPIRRIMQAATPYEARSGGRIRRRETSEYRYGRQQAWCSWAPHGC
jgi:hypothetical protein